MNINEFFLNWTVNSGLKNEEEMNDKNCLFQQRRMKCGKQGMYLNFSKSRGVLKLRKKTIR